MADIPDHILRRSAEARAKREGRSVDEVLAEMKGESSTPPVSSPSGGGAAEGVGGGPAPEVPDAGGPEPQPPALTGAALLTAVAEARRMPESLVERSAKARAKKTDTTVEDVLTEWANEEGLTLSSPSGGGAAEGGGGGPAPEVPPAAVEPPPEAVETAAAAGAVAPIAVADIPTIDADADPSGAPSDRLVTVIRAGEVQRIRSASTDRVDVWPHLLAIEFVALLVVLTILVVLSIFLDAPLLEFANFNEQPNPSKAPWYFLGLQELLAYFDPQVAGIIIPGFGLVAIALIPFIDKNPSVRPSHRKLAIMIFTFFIMAAAVLTIFGSFFRGPGFNFTFPWEDGIFFDDLKSLLE